MSGTTAPPPPPQPGTEVHRRRRVLRVRRLLGLEAAKGAARSLGATAVSAVIWWIREH